MCYHRASNMMIPARLRVFVLEIRNCEKQDAAAIADLYHSAVHGIRSPHYTPEQLEAWAPSPPDYAVWSERLAKTRPYICISENAIAGFIELADEGHIGCLYVHPLFQRRGVASFLYGHAERAALDRGDRHLDVDASHAARVFFERKGFTVVAENQVVRKGQALTNVRMVKSLERQKPFFNALKWSWRSG